MYLEVDSGKVCYVILPNGGILESTAGVIDYDWEGIAGRIKLIVPSDTNKIAITDLITSSLLIGKFTTSASADLFLSGAYISGVSAKNSLEIDAFGCSLSNTEIALLLAELVAEGNENGTLNLLGGLNADYATWTAQAQANLVTLSTTLNWTVSYVGE